VKETVALYVRLPADLRQRLELGRTAGYADAPWHAPTMQAFLVALLDQQLPQLPPPPPPPKPARAKPKKKKR
jgi:hypothetical protein